MAYTEKAWELKTYATDTETDFITGAGVATVIDSLAVVNTSGGDLTAKIVKTDASNVALATVLHTATIAAATPNARLDVPNLNLIGGQKLRITASGPGLEFSASGVQRDS